MNCSLLSKINKYMIDIVNSYLIISEDRMNKNKELLMYNFGILARKDETINVRSFSALICGYCVNCNDKGLYFPILNVNNRYKIVFNNRVICGICFNSYFIKNEAMIEIKDLKIIQ